MKYIKIIIAAIAVMLCAIQADAKLSGSQLKQFVSMFNEQCPMAITPGMMIQRCELVKTDGQTAVRYHLKVNPPELGIETQAFKDEINGTSDAEMFKALGPEFNQIRSQLGCPVQVVYNYPDGTSSKVFTK